jgi:hypothetical protein
MSYMRLVGPECESDDSEQAVCEEVEGRKESIPLPRHCEPNELQYADSSQGEASVHFSPLKKSNLDATGMRIVRKGCVVEYPKSGCTARVVKVRLGQFWPAGKADGAPSFLPCSQVRVVA